VRFKNYYSSGTSARYIAIKIKPTTKPKNYYTAVGIGIPETKVTAAFAKLEDKREEYLGSNNSPKIRFDLSIVFPYADVLSTYNVKHMQDNEVVLSYRETMSACADTNKMPI
jgi:hypothetical protein